MSTLAEDATKDVAVFINDFNIEFANALEKLSQRLGRHIKGITLIDQKIYNQKRHKPDIAHIFQEIVCDFSDDAALRKTIRQFEDNLLVIDASSERNQPYLAKVLPHTPYLFAPTESSLLWSTHKGQMRALLGSYNPEIVPLVQTVQDDSEKTIQKVLTKLSFPMIIKPTGLASSLLVNKVHNEAELRKNLTHSFEVIHDVYARDAGRGNPEMIVEEFMEGDMYSIDMYVSQTGQTWSLPPIRSKTAHALGLEGFYEYQLETYIELDEAEVIAAQATAAQAAHALGLRSCTAHVELYRTPEGWKIIELGPRAGGYRQYMYEAAYGVDHAYNELLVKIGLEPEIPAKPIAYSLITNTYADEEGVIETIDGVEAAREIPSVDELVVQVKPGQKAVASGKGGKIVVMGYLCGKDQQQVAKDADNVRRTIRIKVTPEKQNV
jgi:biotin carboxylase